MYITIMSCVLFIILNYWHIDCLRKLNILRDPIHLEIQGVPNWHEIWNIDRTQIIIQLFVYNLIDERRNHDFISHFEE
jgi:hypothetical protein